MTTTTEQSHKKIKIMLADDHPVTRAGIRKILETAPDIEIVGEACSGFEVQELVGALLPDVLLLDLQMPGPRPSELERWVRERYPKIVTLILTAHSRDSYLATMMDAGVAGFLSKQESEHTLISSIRRAVEGELLFSQEQYSRATLWRRDAGAKWESLTERQRNVVCLVAKGKQNALIARELGISTKTVAYHMTEIMKRLGVSTRGEAVAWIAQHAPENLE
ncbi:MAG: DNA-binding response regulator [Chloroflexi bacterium HGW-Chloroflexi-6]|nr:MAG: DNA-binding response regulator [Chloroflexi bacterium HGW-Chloroflexi-6]